MLISSIPPPSLVDNPPVGTSYLVSILRFMGIGKTSFDARSRRFQLVVCSLVPGCSQVIMISTVALSGTRRAASDAVSVTFRVEVPSNYSAIGASAVTNIVTGGSLTSMLTSQDSVGFNAVSVTFIQNITVSVNQVCFPCGSQVFEFQHPQCSASLVGLCANCTVCAQGTWRSMVCGGLNDTQCTPNPSFSPSLPISFSSTIGFASTAVSNLSYTQYQETIGFFAAASAGTTGTVQASLGNVLNASQSFSVSTLAAVSFSATLLDSSVYYDSSQIRVVFQVQDSILNAQTLPATMYVQATLSSSQVNSTCVTSAVGGTCVAIISSLPSTWLTGTAGSNISVSAGFVNQTAGQAGPVVVGTVSIVPFVSQYFNNSIIAYLVARPLYQGDTFLMTVVGHANTTIGSYSVQMSVDTNLQILGVTSANTSLWTLSASVASNGRNVTVVGFLNDATQAPLTAQVDSMGRQLDQTLFQVQVAVLPSAASGVATINATTTRMSLAIAAPPVISSATPVLMFDRVFEPNNVGRVYVVSDFVACVFAYAQQGQLVNLNLLNPQQPSQYSLNVKGWSFRNTNASLLTAGLQCSSNSSAVSVATGCGSITLGSQGGAVLISGSYLGNVLFSLTLLLWVPTLPLSVTMNASKLLMFYGMLDPQNNCQPLYTRAKLTATTAFVGGSRSVTADVTSLVAWSLNSANTSVAVVDTSSASIIGRSFGSTVVSFLGSTSSGVTVTVSSDTLAFAIGVDVATVAQLNVGLPSSQFAPLSSQIVNVTAVQGNITQVGSSQSLVATGVVFDPIRNVQYRHPLSSQSGLNVTPLNTSIATASNTSVTSVSSGTATMQVVWGGGVCAGSTNYTTYVLSNVILVAPVGISVSPSPVQITSASDPSSLVGVPTSVQLTINVTFSDGSSALVAASDPRIVLSSAQSNNAYLVAPGTNMVSAGSARGSGTLTVMFTQVTVSGTVTVTANVGVNYVGSTGLSLSLSPFPAYPNSASVNVASLSLLGSSSQYQQATPNLKMSLSNSSSLFVSNAISAPVYSDTASPNHVTVGNVNGSVVFTALSNGTASVVATFGGQSSSAASLIVQPSRVTVKTISNARISGYSSGTNVTLSGTKLSQATFQLLADVTMSDNTVILASSLFGPGGILYSNLLSFSSSLSAAASVNSSGIVTLVGNAATPVTLTISAVGAPSVSATVFVSCNLSPDLYDVDLGAASSDPLGVVGLRSMLRVPVRINTGVTLAAFSISVSYDSSKLSFISGTAGANQGGGLFDAASTNGVVTFGGLCQVAAGSAQEIAVLTFTTTSGGTAVFSGTIWNTVGTNGSDVGSNNRSIIAGQVSAAVLSSRRRSAMISSVGVTRQRRSSSCGGAYPLGDVDLSCQFDIKDVLFAQAYVVASQSGFTGSDAIYASLGATQLGLLDANHDGIIDTNDVVLLNRVQFQLLRFVSVPTINPVGSPTSKCQLEIDTWVSQNPSLIVGQDASSVANTLIYFDIRSTSASFQAEFAATFGSSVVSVQGSSSAGLYGGLVAAQSAGSGLYRVVVNSTIDVSQLFVSVLQVTTNLNGVVDSARRVQFMSNYSLTPQLPGLVFTFVANGTNVSVSETLGYTPFATLVSSQTTAICQAMRMPQNLMLTPITGGTSVLAMWNPPQTPPYAVAGYLLMYRQTPSPPQANANTSIPNASVFNSQQTLNVTGGTSVTVTGLQPFIYYDFEILAYTVQDGNSFVSAIVQTQTTQAAPVTPPLSVSATTVSYSSVQISWQPPNIVGANGIVTSYKVTFTRLSGQPRADPNGVVTLQTNVGNVTTFLQTGLEAAISYSFTVLAVTVADGVSSAPVSATTLQNVPGLPPTVTLTALTSTSINVAWTAPPAPSQHGDIVGYMLNYTRASVTTWPDGTAVTDSTFGTPDSVHIVSLGVVFSYTIANLVPDITYNVTVLALNQFAGPASAIQQLNTLQDGTCSYFVQNLM